MEKTYERHDIENTPFSAMKCVEEEKVMITLGNKIIISKEFNTIEEATNYVKGVEELPWELILNASSCFTEFILKAKKEEETQINNNKN